MSLSLSLYIYICKADWVATPGVPDATSPRPNSNELMIIILLQMIIIILINTNNDNNVGSVCGQPAD